MDRKLIVGGAPFLIGCGAVLIGTWQLLQQQALTPPIRITLAAGLAVGLAGAYLFNRLQQTADKRLDIPLDDELSHRLKDRASHAAFRMSLVLWGVIFLFHDRFAQDQTMLGLGILGQAGLYGLCLLYFKKTGPGHGQ